MSEKSGVKPSCSKKLRMADVRDTLEESQEAAEQLEECFQDQVIVAPEIMRKILGYLDMRSLKKVRLVCKSWLIEAQYYMESRGIIRLWSPFSFERMIQLVETQASKIPTLPSPFQALDVDLYEYDEYYQLVPQTLVLLPSPLLTRFYPAQLSLGLAIQVVVQHASSLEYLGLHINAGENGDMPLMYLNKKFPKLRHLDVVFPSDFYANLAHFLRIVPWIVNGSPNIETFELDALFLDDARLISALVMKVDIKNLKTFKFKGPYSDSGPGLSDAALEYFLSIPFSRLQHFCLLLGDSEPDANVWISVVTRSFMTLQELEVPDELDKEDFARVPVCPNVQRLHVTAFPYLKNFVPTHFPSLQALTVTDFEEDQDVSSDIIRLVGLKSLKIIQHFYKPYPAVQVVQFFNMFPSLECLSMEISALKYCCMIISETHPSLNLLASIKHVEIHDDNSGLSRDVVKFLSYSSLAILRGLKSLTVTASSRDLMMTEVPLDLFPCLKLIQFPWNDALDMEKILEMSRGVEKVWISNCCSVLRDENSGSKIRLTLTEFFEAARNAECSCEHTRMRNLE